MRALPYIAQTYISPNIVLASETLDEMFSKAIQYAISHNIALKVKNTTNGATVNIDHTGHVTPVTHTHGGPYAASTCTVLNCGEN